MNVEKLKELKDALESENEINNAIRAVREQFEREHSELFRRRDNYRETISNLKSILTENAEAGYEKDGLKKRLGGIGIRVSKIIDYDTETATEWAKEHRLCLTLDKKAFEQIAKTQEIDFVTMAEKVTVTFPKEITI